MALRSALDQAWYVTLPVLAFLGWVLLTGLAVFAAMESFWTANGVARGDFVGQTAVSGVIGLLVLAGLAVLLGVVYAELGETTPAPSAWPPGE